MQLMLPVLSFHYLEEIEVVGKSTKAVGKQKTANKNKKKERVVMNITPTEAARVAVPLRKKKSIVNEAGPSNRAIPISEVKEMRNSEKIEDNYIESPNINSFHDNYSANLFKPQVSILQLGGEHHDQRYEKWMNNMNFEHIPASAISGFFALMQALSHLGKYFTTMRQKLSTVLEKETAQKKELDTLKKRVQELRKKLSKQKLRTRRKEKALSKYKDSEEERAAKSIDEFTKSESFVIDIENLIKGEAERTLQVLKDRGTLESEFHNFEVFHQLLKRQAGGSGDVPDQFEDRTEGD